MPDLCSNDYTEPFVGSSCCAGGCTVQEACENCFFVSCSHYGSNLPFISNISVESGDMYDADFSYNELTSIPSGAFSGVRIFSSLNLSHNELSTLPMGAFSGLEVVLHSLDLCHNDFEYVPVAALQRMDQLVELRLDHNHIHDFSSAALDSIADTLEFLTIDFNHIHEISDEAFLRVSNLRHLSVRGNHLDSIGFVCTQPLTALRSVDMSDMHLLRVDQYCFKGATSLETIYLEGNELSTLEFARHTRSLKYLYVARNHLHYIDACDLIGLPLRYGSGVLDYTDNPIHCSCELAWLSTQTGLSTLCENPLQSSHLTLKEFVNSYCVALRDTDFLCTQLEFTNALVEAESVTLRWRSLVTDEVIGFVVSLGAHFESGTEHRELAVDNRTFEITLRDLNADSEYHMCIIIMTKDATFGQRQCLTIETAEHFNQAGTTDGLGGAYSNVDMLLMYRILCTIFLGLTVILLIVVLILGCKLRRRSLKAYGPSFINSTYGKITRKFKSYRNNSGSEDITDQPPPPPISSLPHHVKGVGTLSGSDYSHTHSHRSDTTLPLPPIPSCPYHDHVSLDTSLDRTGSGTPAMMELSSHTNTMGGVTSDYEELTPRSPHIPTLHEHISVSSHSLNASIEMDLGFPPPIPASPPPPLPYDNNAMLDKSSF